MSRARLLVDALATAAARFSPDDRKEKLRLLERLHGERLVHPGDLQRYHETLCFLQAYPDDPEVLARVDRALAEFPARVARLPAAGRARLYDSGIAGTTLDYPFGFPMACWLAGRFPRAVGIRWRRFTNTEALDETLALLATSAEGDAFSEGGMGWRRWLQAAKGGRRISDLQLLVGLFGRSRLPPDARDTLFESLGLPIVWRLADARASRTLAKRPPSRPFFHEGGLARGIVDLAQELRRPPSRLRRAPRPQADALIEAARVAMATRARELHAFSHPNPDDVLVIDTDRGLRIALVGIAPRFRLPLEAYYAFLALKNGVPVGYGGGWEMFGALDWAMNIFPSFRQGESAFVATQVLRAYHRVFRMRTVVVDRYQLGHGNEEALRSGAFYFYHRLGFRPRRPEVLGLLEAELAKREVDPAYRSPRAVLERLAADEIYLTLPGGHPQPENRFRSGRVAGLVAHSIAREFDGDRTAAVRESAARVGRALGARGWRRWPVGERRAFERLALTVGLIPDLARWPRAERHRLVTVLRAKGGRSESAYARARDAHRRFRRSLEALAQAFPDQSGRESLPFDSSTCTL